MISLLMGFALGFAQRSLCSAPCRPHSSGGHGPFQFEVATASLGFAAVGFIAAF
jgi:hypothetical protein